MTATKISSFVPFIPAEPTIDSFQTKWAAQELTAIIEKLGVDSPVAMVLRHARREIVSLTTAPAASTVVGPFRIAA